MDIEEFQDFSLFRYKKNTVHLMHQCGHYIVIISRAVITMIGSRLQEFVYSTKKTF